MQANNNNKGKQIMWTQKWFSLHFETSTDWGVFGNVQLTALQVIVKLTNKMQLYRLFYYFKSALHVSGNVFARHQEHLTVFTVSGSVHPSCCRLTSRQQLGWTLPDTVNTVKCSWWRAKTSPDVEPTRNNKLTLRWLMSYIYGAPILDVSRSHTTTQHSR